MSSLQERAREITLDLYEHGMIKTWHRHNPEGWILVSGIWSPFYIQLRALCSYPLVLQKIGEAMSQLIRENIPKATRIVGIAMAGIPIAIATSLASGLPCTFTRKEIAGMRDIHKSYGEHSSLEGELFENDFIVLVDDVVTRFDTKLQATKQVQDEIKRRRLVGIHCRDVAVILDREQGASEMAKAANMTLHSLIRFKSEALRWLSSRMNPLESEVIRAYLDNPEKYQKPSVRKELANKCKKDEKQPTIDLNGVMRCSMRNTCR